MPLSIDSRETQICNVSVSDTKRVTPLRRLNPSCYESQRSVTHTSLDRMIRSPQIGGPSETPGLLVPIAATEANLRANHAMLQTAVAVTDVAPQAQLLSIVIPCYNEEDVINETARRLNILCDELAPLSVELIFVDDGS